MAAAGRGADCRYRVPRDRRIRVKLMILNRLGAAADYRQWIWPEAGPSDRKAGRDDHQNVD
jgi:hypothetical protein